MLSSLNTYYKYYLAAMILAIVALLTMSTQDTWVLSNDNANCNGKFLLH